MLIIPIILCSGMNKHMLGDDYFRVDFSGHIVKPYDKKELVSRVREVLDGGNAD